MIRKEILFELESEEEKTRKFYERMGILYTLKLKKPNQLFFGLRKNLRLMPKPSHTDLKKFYDYLVDGLNKNFSQSIEKTTPEKIIAGKIAEATKLKFYHSCWLPGGNVDFFFPCISGDFSKVRADSKIPKSFRMRGLVFEIDGVIHNHENKMKKDEIKLGLLSDLGIGLASIENRDLYEVNTKNFITKLNTLPRLDSRARNRVWEKIYNSTLLYYGSDELLEAIYGSHFVDLCRKYHNIPNSNFYK